jgi:hypothetical protein
MFTTSKIPKDHKDVILGMLDICKIAVEKGGNVSIKFLGNGVRDWDSFYEFSIEWPTSDFLLKSESFTDEKDTIEITNVILQSDSDDLENKDFSKPKNRY